MPPNSPTPTVPVAVERIGLADGAREAGVREAPAETPVNVVYAPIPFAVMMCTPQDLEDFTSRLAEAVADLASAYAPADGTRRYRLVIGGHPAVASRPTTSSSQEESSR